MRVPPFFLYDSLDWMNVSCLGGEYAHFKHSDDYWMLRHAAAHPMRTRDPSAARLFFVGGLFNLVVENQAYSHKACCLGNTCDDRLVVRHLETVWQSEWYARRNGSDHVVVASHYASLKLLKRHGIFDVMNVVRFEHNLFGQRCHLASTYVGRKCRSEPKRYDVSFVGAMHPTRAKFHLRRETCAWLKGQTRLSVGECGQRQSHCPVVAQSRLGLHMRGDTFGSNRLMDILLSDTVPVFTHPNQYSILPPFFPWRSMGMLADTTTRERFFESLVVIRSEVHRVDLRNTSTLLDWTLPHLFERYMVAFGDGCASVMRGTTPSFPSDRLRDQPKVSVQGRKAPVQHYG